MVRSVICLLFACVISGCGGSDPRVETFPASGSLSVDGKPFGPAQLSLIPMDASIPSASASVSVDGKFVLSTYEPDDGAAVGEFKVSLLMDPMAEPFRDVPPLKPTTTTISKPSEGQDFVLDLKLETSGKDSGSDPAGGADVMPEAPSAVGLPSAGGI
jgi:hypothetical protein